MKIQVIILCGGEGTRVKHMTGDTPKCVYDINGKPFMLYMMEHLSQFPEVSEFILCCSDKTKVIYETLHEHVHRQMNKWIVHYVSEPKPAGTFAGMLSAIPFLNSTHILVLNGDTFCPIDLPDIINFHLAHRYTQISVLYSGNIHSGIWLVNSGYLNAIKDLHCKNKEELLPSACRIDIPYDECAWTFRCYDSPPFIDIGTESGIQEAIKKL